jgi:hypothetical protein
VTVGLLNPYGKHHYDLRYRAYPFSVTSERRDLGVVCLDHKWQHVPRGVSRAAAPTMPVAG